MPIFNPPAGGAGGTPASTVTDETAFGIPTAVGVDTPYARQGHTHGSPDASMVYGTMTYGGGIYGTSMIYPQVIVKDFGTNLVNSGEWTISDANVFPTSHITCWLTAEATSGRDGDEAEMEPMDVIAKDITTGSFTLAADARDGPVDGQYKFAYIVGGA